MTLNRSRLTEFLTPPAANPVTLLPRSLNGWIIIVDPEKSIYPVVGAMALSGNPYDGHTLTGVLQQVRRMNVLLCCAGHNLRLILKRLRFFLSRFVGTISGVDTLLGGGKSSHQTNLINSVILSR